jgi:uncharacterized membrane protein
MREITELAAARVAGLSGILGLLGILGLPAIAAAEEPLPWTGRVTGVAPADTLTVRALPDETAEDIGALDPLTAPVEVTGVDPSGAWVRIVWEDGDGWVPLRNIERVERPRLPGLPLPAHLLCLGAEPFWAIALEDRGAVYATPDDPERAFAIEWAGRSVNVADHALGFLAGPFTGMLSRAECSDEISGRTYGWTIEVVRGPGVYGAEPAFLTGCCFLPLP